jgi:hypothetical protein
MQAILGNAEMKGMIRTEFRAAIVQGNRDICINGCGKGRGTRKG